MVRKMSNQEFKDKAYAVHGDEYIYTDTVYKSREEKVWIECRKHGKFDQSPHDHLSGNGCKLCGFEKRSLKNSLGINYFLTESNKKYGNFYDYSFIKFSTFENKNTNYV